MKLTKYEQSGFILQTDGGFRLAIDIGNKTPETKAQFLALAKDTFDVE